MMKKKKTVFALLFALLLFSVFHFRVELTAKGVDLFLRSCGIQAPLAYEKIEWKKGKCLLSGIKLETEEYLFAAEELACSFKFEFFPFFSQVHLAFSHPEITLLDQGDSSLSFLPILLPQKSFALKLDVDQGMVQFIDGMPPLYFSFQSKGAKEEIGTLSLSHDLDQPPLLSVDCVQEGGEIHAELKMEKVSVSELLPLMRYFYADLKSGWQKLEGEIQMQAKGSFSPTGDLGDIALLLSVSDLLLSHPELGIDAQAEEVEGTISLPRGANRELPIWEQVFATLSVKEGGLLFSSASTNQEWGAHSLNATLLLQEKEPPLIALTGIVVKEGIESPLELKGTFCEDGALALDLFSQVSLFGRSKTKIAAKTILQKGPHGYAMTGEADLHSPEAEEAHLTFGCDWKEETLAFTGWVRSEKITPAFYAPLLQEIDSALNLQAELDLIATFDKEKITFSLQADGLTMHHPLVDLYIPSLGKKDPLLITQEGRACFVYTFHDKNFQGIIPLRGATAKEKEMGLLFEQVAGECHLKGSAISVENFSAVCRDVAFTGRLHLSLHEEKIKTLTLENASGSLAIEGKTYGLKGERIWIKMGKKREAGFDLCALDQGKKILHFVGSAEEKERDLFFISTKVSLSNLPAEGDLKTELLYNRKEDKLSFLTEGGRLFVSKKPVAHFAMKGEKKGSEWRIDKLVWDKLQASGLFILEKTRLLFPTFEIQHSKTCVRGSGAYDWKSAHLNSELQAFLAQGATPLPCKIEGAVQEKDGIFKAQNLHVAFPTFGSSCLIEEGWWNLLSQKTEAKKVHFAFTPAFLTWLSRAEYLPKWLANVKKSEAASGIAEFVFSSQLSLRADLKEGAYFFEDLSWELKEPTLRYEASKLHFTCKTNLQKNPLFVQAQVAFLPKVAGVVRIQDNPQTEGLKFHFTCPPNQNIQWESIRGKISGLELQFEKQDAKSDTLMGSMRFDFAQLARFCSPETRSLLGRLKVGRGYELAGELSFPLQFLGDLRGREIQCMGYLFHKLDAQVEISKEKLLVNELVLEDEAGKMEVKRLVVGKEPRGDKWVMEAPLVQLHDVKPSYLRKEEAMPNQKKPLVIQHLTLTGLNGYLNDATTFRAHGNLHFSNAYKKEYSLLDVPFDLIKDVGLDPGLLTPVYGEVELDMRGGKFYLSDMNNVYSEGRRSQFYLADDLSYIDLSGNVRVDVKVKQDVTLKLTEPFVWRVRGTIEKPKYGIKSILAD